MSNMRRQETNEDVTEIVEGERSDSTSDGSNTRMSISDIVMAEPANPTPENAAEPNNAASAGSFDTAPAENPGWEMLWTHQNLTSLASINSGPGLLAEFESKMSLGSPIGSNTPSASNVSDFAPIPSFVSLPGPSVKRTTEKRRSEPHNIASWIPHSDFASNITLQHFPSMIGELTRSPANPLIGSILSPGTSRAGTPSPEPLSAPAPTPESSRPGTPSPELSSRPVLPQLPMTIAAGVQYPSSSRMRSRTTQTRRKSKGAPKGPSHFPSPEDSRKHLDLVLESSSEEEKEDKKEPPHVYNEQAKARGKLDPDSSDDDDDDDFEMPPDVGEEEEEEEEVAEETSSSSNSPQGSVDEADMPLDKEHVKNKPHFAN